MLAAHGYPQPPRLLRHREASGATRGHTTRTGHVDRRIHHRVRLVLTIGLATARCFNDIGAKSMWLDEGFSIALGADDRPGMWRVMRTRDPSMGVVGRPGPGCSARSPFGGCRFLHSAVAGRSFAAAARPAL